MVERQRLGRTFIPQNGNIAIVGIDIRHLHGRALAGPGIARHCADDLAARGDILLARAVHAVEGIAVHFKVARHRAAVQVEAEILGGVDILGGIVQQLDVGVAVRCVIVNRVLQGGIGSRLRAVAVADRSKVQDFVPFAAAARAGAVGKGIASLGTRG